MRKFLYGAAGLLLFLGASAPAQAMDLTGTWAGHFSGISIGVPAFGPAPVMAHASQAMAHPPETGALVEVKPELVEVDLEVVIDLHEGDQYFGKWSDGAAGFPFVCTISADMHVDCADARGHAHGQIISETEMSFCYTASMVGGQTTGCLKLEKVG